jgi:glycosyltransferase involved in cell wall biosynthesis
MISYTITVCNEEKEINSLLHFLSKRIKDDDEIVVQMDSISVTDGVKSVLETYKDRIKNLVVIEYPLNNNFADFKNNLKKHCSKDWIFNIDADELPAGTLIDQIYEILKDNNDVEMFLVPRWNIVEDITEEHIIKWGWKADKKGRINWPDFQTRIYKNRSHIVWQNKVHERLSGFESYSALPEEDEYCLFHTKTIERQEKQNDFYNKI